MSKSTIIPIRLSALEVEQLDYLVENNDSTGFENRSEFMRLLLAREWRRCKGLPKPAAHEWQSASRTKPRKTHENNPLPVDQ